MFLTYSSRLTEFCILSYILGLRHALDADHIAAIDNATRKLINEGKSSIYTGAFFALGHSTMVFILTLMVSVSAETLSNVIPQLSEVGELLGTFISATILYIIGIANFLIFIDIYKKYINRKINIKDIKTGFMTKLLKGIFNIINKEYHMYIIGLLFGLGFNTATEVALLGLSAFISIQNYSISEVLLLPLSFTAGMVLVDSLDGIFMNRVYAWAFIDPFRKLYYNLTITIISVILALFIGSIEFLQIISQEFNLEGGIWNIVNNINFEGLGYIAVLIFGIGWIASIIYYKIKIDKK
ncbi:MAG: HoxN/HupN/NixA family nickel/cobalt transporter [Sulfolobaceae archaeon]